MGKWHVKVHGDAKGKPMVLDLMARGVLKPFSLEVKADPRNLATPGKVKLLAYPRYDGKLAKGRWLQAEGETAEVPGVW